LDERLKMTIEDIPIYSQSRLYELIRFTRVDVSSAVIDVYPGDVDWTVFTPTS